jgi:hypothetical protein
MLRDTTNAQPNAKAAAPGSQPVKTFARRKVYATASCSESPPPAQSDDGGDVNSCVAGAGGAAWMAHGLSGRRASTFVPFPSLSAAEDYLSRRKGNALKVRQQRLVACLAELAGQYAEVDSFELAVEEASPAKGPADGKGKGAVMQTFANDNAVKEHSVGCAYLHANGMRMHAGSLSATGA